MKNLINKTPFLLLLLLISRCTNSEPNKENSKETKVKSEESKIDTILQEHNKDLKPEIWDTLLPNRIQIQIQHIGSGNYVRQDYFDEEGKQYIIDRYYFDDVRLRVSKGKLLILDTLIKKEAFKGNLNEEFYAECIPFFYSFKELENSTIRFFGSLSVPETDWSYLFFHDIDLKSKELKQTELIWDEFQLNTEQYEHTSKALELLTDTLDISRLDSFVLHTNQFTKALDTIHLSKNGKIGIYKVSEDGKKLLANFESNSIDLFKKLFPYQKEFKALTKNENIFYRLETNTFEGFFITVYFEGKKFDRFEIVGMINM